MIFLETKSVDDIKLGDLIELSRMFGVYAHWAVYVGNGNVIHLSPPPSKSPAAKELCSAIMASSGATCTTITGEPIDTKLFGSIKVRKDKLEDVAAGSAIVVNNECDSEMKPYPDAIIVKRAESKLGTNAYNPFTWNCEHFATWCRYGKAVSKQVPFSKGLSNDAYLVRLDGIHIIPPGSLPNDIGIKADASLGPLLSAGFIPHRTVTENIAERTSTAVGQLVGIEITPRDQIVCTVM